MKRVISVILALTAVSVLANNFKIVFITKKVDDKINALSVEDSMKVNIKESIYDFSPEYALGDDGNECDVDIEDITFTQTSDLKVVANIKTQQLYVNTYGCMSWPIMCELTIEKIGSDYYKSSGSCD